MVVIHLAMILVIKTDNCSVRSSSRKAFMVSGVRPASRLDQFSRSLQVRPEGFTKNGICEDVRIDAVYCVRDCAQMIGVVFHA